MTSQKKLVNLKKFPMMIHVSNLHRCFKYMFISSVLALCKPSMFLICHILGLTEEAEPVRDGVPQPTEPVPIPSEITPDNGNTVLPSEVPWLLKSNSMTKRVEH